ncbi:hypothetical protein FIU89_15500 [Roseovarius sp. THAF27]|nr:hypothetical protein FIU89_15500 [Roseovarius sp. THAF27]
MTQRDTSTPSHDELEEEIRILRAALARLGGDVLAEDILRADRDDCESETLSRLLRQRQKGPFVSDEVGRAQTEAMIARKRMERAIGD